MAVPLSSVDRLEEVPRATLERVGPQAVMQYREEILPLVEVSRVLSRGGRERKDPRVAFRQRVRKAPRNQDVESVQIVVCADKGQRFGLIVEQILDIVEESAVSTSPTLCPGGVRLSGVVQGRVTEFLDLQHLVRAVDPDVAEPPQPVVAKT
jgi:two-component system chemotaxis sensor kinase CheA